MSEHTELPEPEDEHEHISEEDALDLIEDNLNQEVRAKVEIPRHDLGMIREFLMRFNVEGVEKTTYDDLSDIWYRLTKDNSLSGGDSHIPGIYPPVLADFAYLLTDFRTKLEFSTLPMPIHISDFIKHASEIEGRKFSPRLWIIEKHAIPNLTALGMDRSEVVESAMSDQDGYIRKAAVTRFLGWLVGQAFLKESLPEKLKEFTRKNSIDEVTLTNIGSVAFVGLLDALDDLEKRRNVYRRGYPVEPPTIKRYQDVVRAMQGIRQWSETLVLGETHEK